jgi:hypothetical protein
MLFRTFNRHDGLSLGTAVQPQGIADAWLVLALEIERFGHVRACLRAHTVIGSYNSPGAACEAADSYGNAWLKKHKAASLSACDCAEVKP